MWVLRSLEGVRRLPPALNAPATLTPGAVLFGVTPLFSTWYSKRVSLITRVLMICVSLICSVHSEPVVWLPVVEKANPPPFVVMSLDSYMKRVVSVFLSLNARSIRGLMSQRVEGDTIACAKG